MNETDLVATVYGDLNEQLSAQKRSFERALARSERSEVAGGMEQSTLVLAPLAAQGSSSGDMLFITDGRKSAEGVGSGTGVPAYYNGTTDSWYRMSDDTPVVT